MYEHPAYKIEDHDKLWEFIDEHPFATVVQNGAEMMATHLPVLSWKKDGEQLLHTHMAAHNEQAKLIQEGNEVLFIFCIPGNYVSPSWIGAEDVGTWCYSSVHVWAEIKPMDRDELRKSVDVLTKRLEGKQDSPVMLDDLPDDMVEEHLSRIIGFNARPTKMKGISKWHQDHDEEERELINIHLGYKMPS